MHPTLYPYRSGCQVHTGPGSCIRGPVRALLTVMGPLPPGDPGPCTVTAMERTTSDDPRGRARRIASLKTGRGWTWARVAEEVGVSADTVESWVYRGVKPSWPNLRRLAQVFDVSPTWIETGENSGNGTDPVATLEHRVDQIEMRARHGADLGRFVQSNIERIGGLEHRMEALEASAMRVESELAGLRELMEGTATAVKALRTAGVAPPQPAVDGSPRQERRTIGGRRRTDPQSPPGS